MTHNPPPSYIELYHSGVLKKHTDLLLSGLESCRLCPRNCGVNRLAGETGYCRTGRVAVIARSCIHRGEEPVLSGEHGIGNIFFSHCNLRCVYCQNHQISQPVTPPVTQTRSGEIADVLINFQNQGCSSVGFVTPTHVVPQILEGLLEAIPRGFNLPLVYNTNAYDNAGTLKRLEGIFDIYLPDLKYSDDRCSERYSSVPDYVIHSRKSISEMYRQLGSALHLDEKGMLKRGLIIRHLVMPGNMAGTYESMKWISENLSNKISISLMAQYYPVFRAAEFLEINRSIREDEYEQAIECMSSFGLNSGWVQDMNSHQTYRPDFDAALHPFEYRV